MGKIRGDPMQLALAHPTRLALFESLVGKEELSTVQLSKEVGVSRYHLYHHLEHLVKIGVIENHRIQGRARWWRIQKMVSPPTPSQTKSLDSGGIMDNVPIELLQLLDQGASMHFVPIGSNAKDTINSKQFLVTLAKQHGIELDLPFTFMPGGVILVSKGK